MEEEFVNATALPTSEPISIDNVAIYLVFIGFYTSFMTCICFCIYARRSSLGPDVLSDQKLKRILRGKSKRCNVYAIKDTDHVLWSRIDDMVKSTWKYSGQLGRDAMCLHHSGLDVKHLFVVQNQDVWQNYCQALREKQPSGNLEDFYVDFPPVLMQRKKDDKELINDESLTSEQHVAESGELAPKMPVTTVADFVAAKHDTESTADVVLSVKALIAKYEVPPCTAADVDATNATDVNASCSGTESPHTPCADNAAFEIEENAVHVDTALGVSSRDVSGETASATDAAAARPDDTIPSTVIEIDSSTEPEDSDHNQRKQQQQQQQHQQQQQQQPTLEQLMTLNENEVFLFHGTKLENLGGLIRKGFRLKRARDTSLYGRGLYFTDSSQKADQYCDHIYDRRSKSLAMVVAKVVLGDLETYEDGDKRSDADTVLGGKGKRFKEYIKFDESQCYPAFIVVFDRMSETIVTS